MSRYKISELLGYVDFTLDLLEHSTEIEERYFVFINEITVYLSDLCQKVDPNKSQKDDEKISLANIKDERHSLLANSKEFCNDINHAVKANHLDANLSVITKKYTRSTISSFAKAVDFLTNFVSVVDKFEDLKKFKQKAVDLVNLSKKISLSEGQSKKTLVNSSEKVEETVDKIENLYNKLKLIVHFALYDRGDYYKVYFKDLA